MQKFALAAFAAAFAVLSWAGANAQSDAPQMPMMHHQGMQGQHMMGPDSSMRPMRMGGHRGAAHRVVGPMGDDGPSSLAYQGANNKMHRDMAIEFTGDADVDFVRGMIPHHQGAIDMAKIVIAFGSDPEIRKVAEGIIAAQEAEIAQLREWLKARGY